MASTLANVVVLTPPAVPEGEPPMDIIKIKISTEHEESLLISAVLKPEVVDAPMVWKNASAKLKWGVVTNRVKVPNTRIINVVRVITLVVNEISLVFDWLYQKNVLTNKRSI